MKRKLTISIDSDVYDGLYKVVGARRISRFVEDVVRPHVVDAALDSPYTSMAVEWNRETEVAHGPVRLPKTEKREWTGRQSDEPISGGRGLSGWNGGMPDTVHS
jgi:hypothetical protein